MNKQCEKKEKILAPYWNRCANINTGIPYEKKLLHVNRPHGCVGVLFTSIMFALNTKRVLVETFASKLNIHGNAFFMITFKFLLWILSWETHFCA